MRRSEKILLAILVLGLLAWQGGRLVDRLVFDPIRRSRAELDRLDEQLADQKHQTTELSRAEAKLTQWQQRSLPPDPLTAQRLYQQWLTDLSQDCGFAALKVYPDRVVTKNDACVGVLVSINAEATLDQLGLFLARFYRTDLAQHITVLNLNSTQDRGDPVLRLTIMAEGLSLRAASPRQRLFPTCTLASDIGEKEAAFQVAVGDAFPTTAGHLVRIGGEYLRVVNVAGAQWTVERGADRSSPRPHAMGELVELVPVIEPPANGRKAHYMSLVAQNPFAKPTPKIVERPVSAREEPAEPEIDPAEFTFLVAAFSQDDKRQAWLYDRLNNENVVIDTGQPFVVAGIEGVVRMIGDDFVLLDHNDSRWRLRLGGNLRSMERVPATERDVSDPTFQQ